MARLKSEPLEPLDYHEWVTYNRELWAKGSPYLDALEQARKDLPGQQDTAIFAAESIRKALEVKWRIQSYDAQYGPTDSNTPIEPMEDVIDQHSATFGSKATKIAMLIGNAVGKCRRDAIETCEAEKMRTDSDTTPPPVSQTTDRGATAETAAEPKKLDLIEMDRDGMVLRINLPGTLEGREAAKADITKAFTDFQASAGSADKQGLTPIVIIDCELQGADNRSALIATMVSIKRRADGMKAPTIIMGADKELQHSLTTGTFSKFFTELHGHTHSDQIVQNIRERGADQTPP